MQHPFFEHLSVLAGEYERLVFENKQLRSQLAACHDTAEPHSQLAADESSSAQTCRHSQRDPRQGQALPCVGDVQQPSLPNILRDSDFGGEPDRKAFPPAPRVMLQQQAHHAAPTVDQIKEIRRTSGEETTGAAAPRSATFGVSDIKDKIKSELLKGDEDRDVSRYCKEHGWAQRIARNQLFDTVTLSIIGIYAVWMAIDSDWNPGDSILNTPWVFIIGEQVFCCYFTVELIIRFAAFKRKLNCFKDAWFVFDSVLVLMMVAETWVLNGIVLFSTASNDSGGGGLGNTAMLRMARLMRLTRLLRMARLVRMVPELFIMIKAIAAAARTVGFTLFLLLIILYVFGIGFKGLLNGTTAGDELFSSVAFAMHSLLVHATLLDNITDVMAMILADSYLGFAMMYICIVMSAITVMNMLIGVLCEVITSVAAAEKEVMQVKYVKETLQELLEISDSDTDGYIDQGEFLKMLKIPAAWEALNGIEIDALMLVDSVDLIFADGQKLLFNDFMEALLQLRGSNTATVKDLVDLRKVLASQLRMNYTALQQVISAVSPDDHAAVPVAEPRTSHPSSRLMPPAPNEVQPPEDEPMGTMNSRRVSLRSWDYYA